MTEQVSHAWSLGDAIDIFDRKERRAVVRLLGGDSAVLVQPRCASALASALNLPEASFLGKRWYLDYHWNWLVGAVTLLAHPTSRVAAARKDLPWLVQNSQEDVDGLIVADDLLILIEAKWDSGWDSKQRDRKVNRCAALLTYIRRLDLADRVRVCFVNVSRLDESNAELNEAARREAPKPDWPVVHVPFSAVLDDIPTRRLVVNNLVKSPDGEGVSDWEIAEARGWS